MLKIVAPLIAFFTYTSTISQMVEVEISSCEGMFNLFQEIKKSENSHDASSLLDSLLGTKPYVSMLAHYNRDWRPNHLPKDVFKRMILSLKYPEEYKNGENQRADAMLVFWNKFYNDMVLFQKNLNQLKKHDLKQLINSGVAKAARWLPKGWGIPNFYLYIHPNGGSTAFAYQDKQGYDFFQLPRNKNEDLLLDQLISTISHESHHLGMQIPTKARTSEDSLVLYFLSLFITEGSATKFVNNAPGGAVPRIRKIDLNYDEFDTEEWRAYTRDEQKLFTQFSNTLRQIIDGKLDKKAVLLEIRNFWLSGNSRYPAYFVGSEMFGAIYFGLGKEAVFETMKHPEEILKRYNASRLAKPELLLNCPAFDTNLSNRISQIGKAR